MTMMTEANVGTVHHNATHTRGFVAAKSTASVSVQSWSAREHDRLTEWNVSILKRMFGGTSPETFASKIAERHTSNDTWLYASQLATSVVKVLARQDRDDLTKVQSFGILASVMAGSVMSEGDVWDLLKSNSALVSALCEPDKEEQLKDCVATGVRFVRSQSKMDDGRVSSTLLTAMVWHTTQHWRLFSKWTKSRFHAAGAATTAMPVNSCLFFQSELDWLEGTVLPLLDGDEDVAAQFHANCAAWRRVGRGVVDEWRKEEPTQMNSHAKAA